MTKLVPFRDFFHAVGRGMWPMALSVALSLGALSVLWGVLGGVLAQPASAMSSDPVFGYWLTANQKAIVDISPCGQGICGRLVWMKNGRDSMGMPKRDLNNHDTAKRSRPFCGLALVGGFSHAGPGVWRDGWIYNPRTGSSYGAELQSQGFNKLKVRGYFGLPLLGKSQIWTRVDDDRGGCKS